MDDAQQGHSLEGFIYYMHTHPNHLTFNKEVVMALIFCMLEIFNIEDVFFWAGGIFLLVLFAFFVFAVWSRLSKRETLYGLPPDDSW